jgi:hypothetical protein
VRFTLCFTLCFFRFAGISPAIVSTSSSSAEAFRFRSPTELGPEPLFLLPSLVETEVQLLGLQRTELSGPWDRTEGRGYPSRARLLRHKVDCLAHQRHLPCHAPQFANLLFSIALPLDMEKGVDGDNFDVWFDRDGTLGRTVRRQNQRKRGNGTAGDVRGCRGHTGSVGGACGLCEGGVCHARIVVGALTNDVGVHANRWAEPWGLYSRDRIYVMGCV